MKIKWDWVLTLTLVVCALTTTGLVVYREFFSPTTGPGLSVVTKPVFINDWRSELGHGVRFGPSNAPVQLMEFADFECPFCATFHETLKTLRDRYPKSIALWYLHYPLDMHRFAEPAARAVECAGDQGHFEAMHDRLFEEQNKFGLKPWNEFAASVGVTDLVAFETCIKNEAPIPRVEAGKRLAAKLNIKGTPALIINGWQLARPPTLEDLDEMVKAVLSGKSPVSGR